MGGKAVGTMSDSLKSKIKTVLIKVQKGGMLTPYLEEIMRLIAVENHKIEPTADLKRMLSNLKALSSAEVFKDAVNEFLDEEPLNLNQGEDDGERKK